MSIEHTSIARRRALKRLFAGVVSCALLGLGVGCATTTTTLSDDELDELTQAIAVRDVGIDHLAAGRTAMSIRKLQQARAMNPDDPETVLWLGEAYRRKGMLGRAEEQLLEAIDLSSKDPTGRTHQETILNLSALYIQMKRYDDAIAQSELLIQDPTFSSPWRALTNRGWAQFQLGDYTEAEESYDAALDFFPTYWPARLNLGILEQKRRNYVEAIREYENALETNRLGADAIAEVNYRLAEVYVALGRRDRAVEHFSVAVEQSPYGEWGTQSKSYLELLR
jgi:tetratricopeptide (TPR) repeat protein